MVNYFDLSVYQRVDLQGDLKGLSLVGNLRWTSIPSRESSNTPSRLHATETGISSSSVDQFGPSAALPLILFYQFMITGSLVL